MINHLNARKRLTDERKIIIYTYAIWIDQGAIAVELSFIKLSIVNYAIWESEPSFSFFPPIINGSYIRRF